MLPNISSPLLVEFGLRLTYSIIMVAALSFIGFGMQPPAADWGLMINENRIGITVQPWAVVAPVFLIGASDGQHQPHGRRTCAGHDGHRQGHGGDMSAQASDVVLAIEDLRIVLDPSGIDIDDDVTFAIHQGEVLGLVGESASGKTTPATAAARLPTPRRQGRRGPRRHRRHEVLSASRAALRRIRGGLISYVPQDASAALNPALRIGDQLMEILNEHSFGSSAAERDARLKQMMDEVLLPNDRSFLRRYPHQLSGGQQQRVAIAMALANRPKVIVLDEPTTALDVTTQAHVLDTVRDLTRSYGVSALYVTHDLAVVACLADRIAVMYAGRLVEIGPKEELFTGAYHPYTRRLLAAIPDITGERALHGIPGWAPRPGQRVPGCAFTPRCDWRIDKCATEFPPYEGPDPEHQVRCWRWQEVKALAAAEPPRFASRRTRSAATWRRPWSTYRT